MEDCSHFYVAGSPRDVAQQQNERYRASETCGSDNTLPEQALVIMEICDILSKTHLLGQAHTYMAACVRVISPPHRRIMARIKQPMPRVTMSSSSIPLSLVHAVFTHSIGSRHFVNRRGSTLPLPSCARTVVPWPVQLSLSTHPQLGSMIS
jgi:hypothetical protein